MAGQLAITSCSLTGKGSRATKTLTRGEDSVGIVSPREELLVSAPLPVAERSPASDDNLEFLRSWVEYIPRQQARNRVDLTQLQGPGAAACASREKVRVVP